jgi:hypothetical protein
MLPLSELDAGEGRETLGENDPAHAEPRVPHQSARPVDHDRKRCVRRPRSRARARGRRARRRGPRHCCCELRRPSVSGIGQNRTGFDVAPARKVARLAAVTKFVTWALLGLFACSPDERGEDDGGADVDPTLLDAELLFESGFEQDMWMDFRDFEKGDHPPALSVGHGFVQPLTPVFDFAPGQTMTITLDVAGALNEGANGNDITMFILDANDRYLMQVTYIYNAEAGRPHVGYPVGVSMLVGCGEEPAVQTNNVEFSRVRVDVSSSQITCIHESFSDTVTVDFPLGSNGMKIYVNSTRGSFSGVWLDDLKLYRFD